MKTNLILTVAAAIGAGYGQWGAPITIPSASNSGGLYHHSGCMPSRYRKAKTRRNKRGGVSQKKVRLLARRANPHGW